MSGTRAAHAQDMPVPFNRNLDVQAFRPAPGPYNFPTVMGARVDGQLGFTVGGFLNYAYGPFTIYNANCPDPTSTTGCVPGDVRSRPVEHLATLNLLATLTLFRRLQIGLDLPLSLAVGDTVRNEDGARVPGSTQRTGFALSDPRLDVKVRLLGEGLRGVGVALNAFAGFPVGRYIAQESFLGDAGFSAGGRAIVDVRAGAFTLAANVGAIWRSASEPNLSSLMSSRLLWGLGVGYDLTPRFGLQAEFFGSTNFERIEVLQNSSIEGSLGVRYHAGPIALQGGVGTGILRGLSSPAARVFVGVVWAPVRGDSDRDGVPDDQDRCPGELEDRDGFEDQDGCADPDNDGDDIPDERDRCANEAEDRDNFQDQDGCPEPDNDNDGIADGYDSCPNEPEDRDGDRDDDGCPDDDRDRDGVPDARDRCPTQAEDTDGFEDEDGCPEPDNDRDGVPDESDQCADQMETPNNFQDEDGCPDTAPDQDRDGIPDSADRCPTQPETYNGVQDDDGCPERGPSLVRFEGDQIVILQQVNFATNSDRITGRDSFRVLDAVVAVLQAHAEVRRLEIQGHTDNAGDAAANRTLSEHRAEAVKAYLVSHSIDAGRLTTRGFGPDRPLESNTSRRGRARNRRVEFHITPVALPAAAPAAATPAPAAATDGAAPAAPTTPAAPAAAPAAPSAAPAPPAPSAAPAAPSAAPTP